MQPVKKITGHALPLNRSDVDTDQIIPAHWLKRVQRTGFGEGLFSSWREDPRFVLNQPEYAARSDLDCRTKLRYRIVARTRCLGAHGLRIPSGHLAAIWRHLPEQLNESRTRAGGHSR